MFEILLELSKRDIKWVNAVGKMVLIDLLNGGVATNLQFVKKKKKEKQTKNKQTKKLWRAIKWSIACT